MDAATGAKNEKLPKKLIVFLQYSFLAIVADLLTDSRQIRSRDQKGVCDI